MPIPLGLAIGAAAAQGIGGIYNIAAGTKQRREGERLFEQQLEDLRSGKYDLSVSQAERDVADLARQYGEQAAMTAGRRGEAAQQAALFGLRGGDPRLAAMMPAQTRAMGEATQQAELAGLGTSLAAQQRLAGTEQAMLTQNEQFRRMLEQMQMQRGAAAGEAGRQQQVAGVGQIASLPADLASLYSATGGTENLIPKGMKEMKNLFDQIGGADGVIDLIRGGGGEDGIGGVIDIINSGIDLFPVTSGGTRDFQIPDYAGKINAQYGSGRSSPPVGSFRGNADGGKAPMITPGEFDHDTNPIDMVAEDGTKVGEVTGGELIFNPDQSETIEELVEKGDGEALIMYLKQLLEQPQFEEQD